MKNKYLPETKESHSQALEQRDNAIWRSLSTVSLIQAAEQFLSTLQGNTKRTYRASLSSIFKLFKEINVFDPHSSLQTFAMSNLEFLLDEIRGKVPGSESTKQTKAAAFIALTRYLQRATGGLVRRAVPNRDKGKTTFRQVRETATTKAMSRGQWTQFLLALKRLSYRDYLIAKTMLQGAKRVSEVLNATLDQVNWANNQITFKQLKSKEIEKFTVITYPETFMEELQEYAGDRKSGYLFTTRNGKPLSQPHLYRIFAAASIHAGIPFRVHPHSLRASAITYLSSHGFAADQIMRVSGHADTKQVRYYDKTPIEHNPSKDVSLI